MSSRIIQRGAEAVIYLRNGTAVKDRIKKSYRNPDLDMKIRVLRNRSETRLLEKASRIISSPVPKEQKDKNSTIIEMPFIKGDKLSETLNNFPLNKQKLICKKIGESLAKLHEAGIIHGDLTTSNLILKNSEVFFIDFGLGFSSHKFEDKAVDIHLFKEALEAKHFTNWQKLFAEFIGGYKTYKESQKVLEQMKKVEARGRYKEKY